MYMYYFVGYELMMQERDPTIVNPNFDDVPSIFEVLSDQVKQKVSATEKTFTFKCFHDVRPIMNLEHW